MFSGKNSVAAVVLAVLCLCMATTGAFAQTFNIDITKPSFQRIPIAIPDFKYMAPEGTQLARDMGNTLSSDLDFSGIFRPLDPKGFLENPQAIGLNAPEIKFPDWKRLGADFLVRGSYQVNGSQLRMEGRLFDVVGGRMVKGKVYEGDVRNWRSMVHDFADEILLALTGERGVFDTKIAYVQSTGSAKEIFYCDFDGNNPVQVTRDNNLALSPAWSSDQGQLAFVSYRDGAPKVYALNMRSGAQSLICGYPGMNISPAWRPGRNELAVTLNKDGNPDIFLISSTGQILQKLVHGWSINVSPGWSPDGRKLAYVSNESGNPQIYVLDVGSGQKKRLTFSGKYNTAPCWSPKGDWIAYSGTAGGTHNVFIIRPDGSDNRQITNGEGSNESPAWSPDGRMLAFSSTRQGGPAIWIMLTNGTGARKLTRQGGSQELPDWSPRMNR
ncbi:MAG: Tol-Pal system beta propeller repeat protein TolB [Desulfobacteraceae bacterium]|nr:Tol-Pal system beta propeller repeat protein TolB [Desulfobacteraceae bacterium]